MILYYYECVCVTAEMQTRFDQRPNLYIYIYIYCIILYMMILLCIIRL